MAFPRLLLATHRYSPLSFLLTLVTVNCVLLTEKMNFQLCLAFIGDPFAVHEIVGTGYPVALHVKVTLTSSLVVILWGSAVISGGTLGGKTKNTTLNYGVKMV